MPETLKNTRAAYNRGVVAQQRGDGLDTCPYGQRKLELVTWWHAGFEDSSRDNIDLKLIAKHSRTLTRPVRVDTVSELLDLLGLPTAMKKEILIVHDHEMSRFSSKSKANLLRRQAT